MIKIDVCIGCKCKECCDFQDGIDLYEFIKSYIIDYFDWEDIEINLSGCTCMKECNGPIVKVNNKVYTNVDKNKALDIIKNIVLKKEA